MKYSEEEILRIVGDPHQVAAELEEFGRDIDFYQANARRFLDEYPDEWVAIFRGEVRAHSTSLDAVVEELERQGIQPGRAFVEFVEKTPRILIL